MAFDHGESYEPFMAEIFAERTGLTT